LKKNYLLLSAASLACLQLGSVANAAPAWASACENLKKLAAPDFLVRAAELKQAGLQPGLASAMEEPQQTPQHCLFRGTIAPRTGVGGQKFGIGFELRMPLNWNGRFLFEGGGAMDGVEFPAYGAVSAPPNALTRGFAVVRTDSGHRGVNWDDGRFAVDQQARNDYAFNALDKVTLKAKQITTQFYGHKPNYSYFVGCSNGGRQAMLVSQRYPLYFDGVVAGNPAFNITRAALRTVWAIAVLAKISPKDAAGEPIISKAFSQPDLDLVVKGVLKQCDTLDGLADGIINDTRACKFTPRVLECKGAKNNACLTKAQVDALEAIATGPRDRSGRQIATTFPWDTGMSHWGATYLGTSPTSESNSWAATEMLSALRYHHLTPPNPKLDPLTMDFQDTLDRTKETEAMNDARSTFMTSFANTGKLILYTGLSDNVLSANDLVAWYEQAGGDTGGNTSDWARLFVIPGMLHCGGGMSTDSFDMLAAIQNWVEHGKAPDRVIATGEAFPGVSRPLCPWPKVARYKGGDTKSAASFACE